MRPVRRGTVYFCSLSCKQKFDADPAAYLGEQPPAPKPAPADTTYTCPMHPEIVRDGPGSCPISGMALEPRMMRLDDENQRQLAVDPGVWLDGPSSLL